MPESDRPERDDTPSDPSAVFEAVYAELHRLAQREMARQPACHTLQPTALVNEAFMRLTAGGEAYSSRLHFIRVAARAMRQILVDHGRRKNADKRMPGHRRIDLSGLLDGDGSAYEPSGAYDAFDDRAQGMAQLERALVRLEKLDADLAELVELRFFGGQTFASCAEILGISERQVYRRWRTARAFLARDIEEQGAADS